MATTQKAYKRAQRLSRYVTQLPPFTKGMFWSDQIIPDGFAKALVNLDISDAGTSIRPRAGYETQIAQTLQRSNLGKPHLLTDLYYYDDNINPDIYTGLQTVVLSFGIESDLGIVNNTFSGVKIGEKYLPWLHSSTADAGFGYCIDDQIDLTYTPIQLTHGPSSVAVLTPTDGFETTNIGAITANTFQLIYDGIDATTLKKVPIYNVLDHELYCFSTYAINTAGSTTVAPFKLTKLILRKSIAGAWNLNREVIEPLELTPAQAYTSGFNMLSNTPYTFINKSGANSIAPTGTIIYMNNSATPTFYYTVGNTYDVHVKYQYTQAGDSFQYKIEMLDLTSQNAEPVTLVDFSTTNVIVCDENTDLVYTYTPTSTNTIIYFTLRPVITPEPVDPSAYDSTYQCPIFCNNTDFEGVKLENFDLSTCKGMVNWFGCLGVYGVQNAPDSIFFSSTYNASYFPYPQNLLKFDEKILAVYNYLDYLLVVTNTSLYLMTMGTSILTSAQRCILTNLNLSEIDANNIQILKDQIFLKTRNKFYVLKPNTYTSDATDLKNYDNSIQLTEFMNSFVPNIAQVLYPTLQDLIQNGLINLKQNVNNLVPDFFYQPKAKVLNIIDEYSEIKQDCVYYNYILNLGIYEDADYLVSLSDAYKFSLVYNIVTRTWVMHIYSSGPLQQIRNSDVTYISKYNGILYCFNTLSSVQTNISLFVPYKISQQIPDSRSILYKLNPEDIDEVPEIFNLKSKICTYIDTGYVTLENINEKRFREIQFNLKLENNNNTLLTNDKKLDDLLAATTYLQYDVFVDGRKQSIQDYDIVESNTNTIFLFPAQDAADSVISGLTRAGDSRYPSATGNIFDSKDEQDTRYSTNVFKHNAGFILDISHFTNNELQTIRVSTLGKGRRIKLQLIISPDNYFELSNINFVYRTMNAR